MEFWGSDPDEPPAPLPPPPPPPLWLQQPPPPPPPQPQSSHCDFTEQRTTRVGCRNSGLGLDNDYLNNVVYVGQGVGRRATENFPIFDNIHKEIQRDGDLENETRKTGCTNPGFGSRQNVAYFGQGTGRANENVDMLYNVNPETQRDVEKEKIRKEIIAAEMAMRRELEAEVREELRIERELALRMEGGNAFDKVGVPMDTRGKSLVQEAKGLSLEEKLATHAAKLQIQGRTETNKMDLLPSHRTSLESKVNETHQEETKALDSAKRGAYTMFDVWGVGNIEGKIDWRCFICQVSATSEADLKQHFNGNEHKAKRAALKAEKSATTTELQVGGKAVHISRSEPRKHEEAERQKKEAAERQAKLDEIAEKQRQRDQELEEKERLRREAILGRPSEVPLRPGFTVRPSETAAPAAAAAAPAVETAPAAPAKYVPRFKRQVSSSAGPTPSPDSSDRWGNGGLENRRPAERRSSYGFGGSRR